MCTCECESAKMGERCEWNSLQYVLSNYGALLFAEVQQTLAQEFLATTFGSEVTDCEMGLE